MKYFIKNAIVLVFLLCSAPFVWAQLIPNGDFENHTNCPSTCGKRITPSCCANWHSSHGIPHLTVIGNYISNMMYSPSSNAGQGIYYNYNFEQGKEYKICYTVVTEYNNCTGQPGPGIVMKAANGVPETTLNGSTPCIEAIPTPTNSQVILTDNSDYSNWGQPTATFTANANYSQLWIYPQISNCLFLWIRVDDIYIYELSCSPLIIDGNTQVSAGIYNNHNTITAGSGNGSQMVSTNPSAAAIEFLAEDYVLLIPDFISAPNSDNYFLATTQACQSQLPDCPTFKKGNVDLIEDVNFMDEQTQPLVFLEVKPNPFSKQSTVTYRLGRAAPVEMQVYDVTGKMVWEKSLPEVAAGEHTQLLNLSAFPAGMYFLNAVVDGKIYNQKLVLE